MIMSVATLASCAEKQTPAEIPALRDVKVAVKSASAYNFLKQGSVSFSADGESGWVKLPVSANSFTVAAAPKDEHGYVMVGASQKTVDVKAEQEKFYLDSEKDFAAAMVAYGYASLGAKEGEVELTPVTAGIRVSLFDSKHYATFEKVKSVCFTADDKAVAVTGQVVCSADGVLAAAKTSNSVTVKWVESDPEVALMVLSKGDHEKAGMAVLPFGTAKGKFTVVTDRYTYTFTTEVKVEAGKITDVELDFCAPDVQPVRKVGIIGDSISTFAGYIDPSYSAFYPANDATAKGGTGTVQSVEKTYWWKVVNEKMSHGQLDVVNSYSGTKVVTEGGVKGFVDRAYRFNDPDIIIIHGGTNDMNQKSPMGDFGWDLPIGQLNEGCYRSAYVKLIKMLQNRYPGVQIIIVVGDRLSYYECYKPDPEFPYATSTIQIAKHFGLPYVDFTANGTSYNSLPKSTGSHPDASGMQKMADQIYSTCKDYLP